MSDERLVDRLQIDAREKVSGRRFAPVAIAIVLVGGLGAALWPWLVTDRAVAVEIVRPVMIEAGGKRARTSVLDASGYVVARRQATVAAEVTGKLVEVGVEEGQAVERGQVLARIDDATEQAQLALVRARLPAGPGRGLGGGGGDAAGARRGTIGAGLVWLLFNGFTVSTLSFTSFTQVVFAFAVTPGLLLQGLVIALIIGLFGGIAPAIRAAHVPIVTGLRN